MSALPAVTLYASDNDIKNAFEILHNPHMCIRCNKSFDLASNLGSHKCYQHPGSVKNGRWTCCDKPFYNLFYSGHFKIDSMFSSSINMPPYPPPIQAPGCQPCDHTTAEKLWNFKDTEQLHRIAGLIPFLNKKKPIDERPGFAVVKVNSQKVPVILRCAKRWMQWPQIDTSEFEYTHTIGDKSYDCTHIEINYISLGGEKKQILYTEDEWNNEPYPEIKGDFISAYFVYKLIGPDGQYLEEEKKIKIPN